MNVLFVAKDSRRSGAAVGGEGSVVRHTASTCGTCANCADPVTVMVVRDPAASQTPEFFTLRHKILVAAPDVV